MAPRRSGPAGRRRAWAAVFGLAFLGAAACGQYGPTGQPPSNRPYESPPPGTAPGLLMALDAKTGHTLWQTSVPLGAVSPPVVVDGTIVVQGGYDCRGPSAVIAAFSASDGSARWQSTTMAGEDKSSVSPCGFASAPVAMPGVVAASANVGNWPVPTVIRGLDLGTGRELWKTDALEAAASGGPLLLLVGNPSGGLLLRAVDPTTGAKRWQSGLNSVTYPLAANGNVALVATSYQATITLNAVDLATGDVLWRHQVGMGDQVLGTAIFDAAVFAVRPPIPVVGPGPAPPPATPPAQEVIGLDLATGQEMWRLGGFQSANPVGLFAGGSGTVFLTSSSEACSYSIEALDWASGVVRWAMNEIPTCSGFGPGFAADGSRSVLAYSTESGTEVVAMDSSNGKGIWARELPKPPMCEVSLLWCRAGLARVAIDGDTVYVALSGRFIAATTAAECRGAQCVGPGIRSPT